MKKKVLLSLMLVCIGIFTLALPNVSAETYGDLTYEISSGEITITDCAGSAVSIVIPNEISGYPVTTIGPYSFSGCGSLTSITIPNSVTTIEPFAFQNCGSLTSIAIPSSVIRIDNYAFSGCGNLASITLPDSVISFGNNVFNDTAYYRENSNWENNVLYIDNQLIEARLFDECAEYSIKPGTKIIAPQAFGGCYVESVIIPDSVTNIGEKAFQSCGSLTSITIPNSVISIGDDAFSYCTALTSITIPSGVISIGDDVFYYCTALTSIDVDSNNNYYSSLNGNLYNKDKTKLIKYAIAKKDTSFEIPESVTIIGDDVFEDCANLTSITIPDGVTSIGNSAFLYCTALTSITIPSSVTNIGSYAFSGCGSLTSITIPNGVTNIGESAFSGCGSLTSITIPNGVTSIENGTFSDCGSLTSITIPDNVTSIGNGAFSGCTGLTNIKIPESVTSIGNGAFSDCTGLTNIKIPESVTSIGSYAFHYTAYYENSSNWENNVLYIGNHLISAKQDLSGGYSVKSGTKTIAVGAFQYCGNLSSITIPDGVTSIGNYAFQGCTGLASIAIPNSVTSIGDSAFSFCMGLTSIIISESVTSIGNGAFSNCSSLTSITIPNGVTSIENNAFYYCHALTSITIPNSVTNIGSYAFYDCGKLSEVHYNGTEQTWNNIQIGNGNEYFANAERKYFLYVELIGADGREIRGERIYVTLADAESGKMILALYNGDRLVDVQSKPCDTEVSFATDKGYTFGKFMVWEDMVNAKPLCDSAIAN